MPRFERRRAAIVLAIGFVLAAALFLGAPQIDLWVSSQFYDPARGGFWLADAPAAMLVRSVAWNLSTAMLLAALAGLGGSLWLRRPLGGVPARAWGFILGLYVLAPGIIVNGILKASWGRARPTDVIEFGGALQFSPAGVIAHQCAANCSFTSGEGASAAALAISALLVLHFLRPRLAGWAWRAAMGVALLVPLAGAALRLMTGRHFLSDTVFSVLIVAAVALVLHRILAPQAGRSRG